MFDRRHIVARFNKLGEWRTMGTGFHKRRLRVGAVSYLNTRPLIEGLGAHSDVDLVLDVPARLPGLLEAGEVDLALVPVIELTKSGRRWEIISDACISCDGATLTVRVFSRVDPAEISTLHVDPDSRSSVALASIIWRERYHRALALEMLPRMGGGGNADPPDFGSCQAVLLIGDKVIDPPPGLEDFSTQVDLGAAWRAMTGLPFVFAAWASRGDVDREAAAQLLSSARDAGVARAHHIAATEGPKMGWPVGLAERYLTRYLMFTMTDRHRQGLQRFLELAGADRPAGVENVELPAVGAGER